ncbi:unnamed protein product [Nyctereutes procyonoides]|uniref:(raccoon dog) hypothetical protein n=1 Tax=Nyctereutes procyonoides TaxID=34880 RepID=A0A811Z5L8_NYCPR|nr:unnamed protein product [Nyctereutes procyonoides]
MLEEAGEVLENMSKALRPPLGSAVQRTARVHPPPAAVRPAWAVQPCALGRQRSTRRRTPMRACWTCGGVAACFRPLGFREQYQKALRRAGGAVLGVLPQATDFVSQNIIQQFMEMGPRGLAMQTVVPTSFPVHDEALLSRLHADTGQVRFQGSASVAKLLLHPATAGGVHRNASWLSHGLDSTVVGLSALLGLSRPFSKLYTNKHTHAVYNFLLLASGGACSTTREPSIWLEDNLDHTDSSILQLYLHMSKPPWKETLWHTFLPELEIVQFSTVHKIIILAEDSLAWEHERSSVLCIPSFTLSHLEIHHDSHSKTLTCNWTPITEMIQQEQPDMVMGWLTNQPQATQQVDKYCMFLSMPEHYLSHYLKEVKQHCLKADKLDPRFVKPAIFCMFLAICIVTCLGIAYTAVQHFNLLFKTVQRLLLKAKRQ